MTSLTIAISTCPNDTFAFHGLLSGRVRAEGLDLRFELMDIEELNQGLIEGCFDVAKASFHLGLTRAADLWVLPVGAALGFGVGPVMLGRTAGMRPDAMASAAPPRIFCPGAHTTATLLYRMFYPGVGDVQQVVFSDIMPALREGRADFGVCIHEGRFTYRAWDLSLVEDLGQRWEATVGAPLPLGGLFARREVPLPQLASLTAAIRDSIEYGHAHREETLVTMRQYAQEMADDVMFSHVDLYVNEWTLDLGEPGVRALEALAERARASGLLPDGARLEIAPVREG